MLNDLKRIKVTFPTEIVKEIDKRVKKNFKNRSEFFRVILEAHFKKRADSEFFDKDILSLAGKFKPRKKKSILKAREELEKKYKRV